MLPYFRSPIYFVSLWLLFLLCSVDALLAQQTEWLWKKLDQLEILKDTIVFNPGFISESIQLFRSNGDRDSVSQFTIIKNAGIRMNYWAFQSDAHFWVAYQIPIKDLFTSQKTSVSLLPKPDGSLAGSLVQKEAVFSSSTDLFGSSGIRKNGSLTRGVTVGSNQDASLESGLRLDLEGIVTDSVYIIANLTDQSTPIQPDGTTQNLREFDRVYIQLRSPRHKLEMGDIDVVFNKSSFAYLNRRLQGLQFRSSPGFGNHTALASVARGLFRTQTLQAIEGVQGPYRLSGNQAEPFVIVIAGTEKVYLDGRLMQRGEDRDYIIDYGIGEITFMPKILINQRTRIVVDFQYLNQDFSRSLIAAESVSDSLWNNKLHFQVGYMRETDSDNTLAQISLSESDIAILQQAGDDDTKAVVTGVTPRENLAQTNSSGIFYVAIDTVINNQPIRFYRYSQNQVVNEPLFDVRFSRILQGNGNYRRAQSGINGVVYEFAGVGLGSYDTLRSLPRPIDHQMITLKSSIKPTKSIEVNSEWALSSFDKNRFSDTDDSDNHDFAVENRVKFFKKADWASVTASYLHKYNGKEFRYFDRPEAVDFQRIWNLPSFSITEQNLHEANLIFDFSDKNSFDIQAGSIDRVDANGKRLKSNFQWQDFKKFGFILQNEWVESTDTLTRQSGSWMYNSGEISYRTSGLGVELKPFIRGISDQRSQKNFQTDSLLANSYGQYTGTIGFLVQRDGKFKMQIESGVRQDRSVLQNQLQKESDNWITTGLISFRSSPNFSTQTEITYLKKSINNDFIAVGIADNDAVFIKSDTKYKTSNKVYETSFLYDVATQRSALLQETYIEVGPELGQYVWDDLNRDGQKHIDEFFPEQTPNEGTYLKQFLPSDDFFPTIDVTARLRQRFVPANFYSKRQKSSFKKIAESVEFQSFIDIRERSVTTQLSDIYLLNVRAFQNDSTTLSGRISLRNELELFPKYRKASFRFGVEQSWSSNRQVFGSEKNKTNRYRIEMSNRLNRYWQLSHELAFTNDDRQNSQLTSRSYQIESLNWQSQINYSFSRSFQYMAEFGYSTKGDTQIGSTAKSSVYRAGGTIRAFLGEKWQGNSRIQFRDVKLTGESGALGQFELTEGAGAGATWLWSVQVTYRNSSLVQTSFNYDGRTIQDRPTIHTGRLIIRALF